ncbi:hypothetical protein Fmac_024220 [Flemingia macrophylla]|uniref:Uncharacterized protein n=1 Tax=Flemingia macrophylla TaxID=520843 RepID=A0ABD1LNS3_9FABA
MVELTSWTGQNPHKEDPESSKPHDQTTFNMLVVKPNLNGKEEDIKTFVEEIDARLGKRFLDYVLNNGFELEPFLGTTLIDMHKKCDSLNDTRIMFDMLRVQTLATWNTMISSRGVHEFWD